MDVLSVIDKTINVYSKGSFITSLVLNSEVTIDDKEYTVRNICSVSYIAERSFLVCIGSYDNEGIITQILLTLNLELLPQKEAIIKVKHFDSKYWKISVLADEPVELLSHLRTNAIILINKPGDKVELYLIDLMHNSEPSYIDIEDYDERKSKIFYDNKEIINYKLTDDAEHSHLLYNGSVYNIVDGKLYHDSKNIKINFPVLDIKSYPDNNGGIVAIGSNTIARYNPTTKKIDEYKIEEDAQLGEVNSWGYILQFMDKIIVYSWDQKIKMNYKSDGLSSMGCFYYTNPVVL